VQAVRGADTFKPPGVAETIDWAAALAALDAKELEPALVDETLGALLKYQDDIAKIRGAEARAWSPTPRGDPSPGRDAGAAGRRGRAGAPRRPTWCPSGGCCGGRGCLSGRRSCWRERRRWARSRSATGAQAHAALRATMVHRHEHFLVFDHAFGLFWRDPEAGRHAAAMAMLEGFKEPPKPPPASRRLAEAMRGDRPRARRSRRSRRRKRSSTSPSPSANASASNRWISRRCRRPRSRRRRTRSARLALPLDARPTRRFRADPAGPVADLRMTVRASLRSGGEILDIARRRRVERTPPLVALCDISGSMSRYAQVLLHFLHAVTNDRDRVIPSCSARG
jgi:hypothetical protein